MDDYTADGRHKCDQDRCEKAAAVNYQTGTVRYRITRTGRYHLDQLYPDEMTNEHWCDEHDTDC
jgi:hypothetical protein